MQKKYIKYSYHICIMIICAFITVFAANKYRSKKYKKNYVTDKGEVVTKDLVLWYGDEALNP